MPIMGPYHNFYLQPSIIRMNIDTSMQVSYLTSNISNLNLNDRCRYLTTYYLDLH